MTITIDKWRRDLSGRMDAKSRVLHGPMRQTVPTSPELLAKRRRHEEQKMLLALAGIDVK